jgi:hypothetical protein
VNALRMTCVSVSTAKTVSMPLINVIDIDVRLFPINNVKITISSTATTATRTPKAIELTPAFEFLIPLNMTNDILKFCIKNVSAQKITHKPPFG